MARGWESKSVQEQIDSARAREHQPRPTPTLEQLEIERKRDSLMLQCTRVRREMESCTSDRHRQTLQNGLSYLETQIADLGGLAT